MRPPGDREWKDSQAEIQGTARPAFVATFAETPAAQSFVDDHWDTVYLGGGALFIHHVPSALGEPTTYTPTGLPCYQPTPQPPEVWFIPGTSFLDVWPFAKRKGFLTPTLSRSVVDDCDVFLNDLASRHPIGIEAVGEGMAMFRRHKDGGAFEVSDMRRVCALNISVLGGPQDASHRDRSMPRHFVKMGFFYLGM